MLHGFTQRISAIIEGVIAAILITLVFVAAIVGVYVMVWASNREDVTEWVAESVDAWRADELTTKEFDVHVSDTHVAALFTEFPEAEEAYVTPESVEENWNRIVTMEREASDRVKLASAPVVERVAETASRIRRPEGEKQSPKTAA